MRLWYSLWKSKAVHVFSACSNRLLLYNTITSNGGRLLNWFIFGKKEVFEREKAKRFTTEVFSNKLKSDHNLTLSVPKLGVVVKQNTIAQFTCHSNVLFSIIFFLLQSSSVLNILLQSFFIYFSLISSSVIFCFYLYYSTAKVGHPKTFVWHFFIGFKQANFRMSWWSLKRLWGFSTKMPTLFDLYCIRCFSNFGTSYPVFVLASWHRILTQENKIPYLKCLALISLGREGNIIS